MSSVSNILIAPLDWGLGHATRCMPIIDLLIRKGHRVIIAGNGDSFLLLKEQYPQLRFYELPGYNISYPSGKNAAAYAFFQTPRILRTIRQEHEQVKDIAEKEKISLILSDNRYGVRHDNVKSIFIGHHIALRSPKGFGFMNPLFLKLHLQQIRKFDALWIPDAEGADNLSGELAHGIDFQMPYAYIGIQSRFARFERKSSDIDELDFSILAVLSGPEPQRSDLERSLIQKLKGRKEKVLLVQGKTAQDILRVDDNILIKSYLNTNDLYVALQKAESIICRSGYSTVMDLAVLGKKAVLIPSSGQTEQEYLAKVLSQKGFAVACSQEDLPLEQALHALNSISGFPHYESNTLLLERELEKYLI